MAVAAASSSSSSAIVVAALSVVAAAEGPECVNVGVVHCHRCRRRWMPDAASRARRSACTAAGIAVLLALWPHTRLRVCGDEFLEVRRLEVQMWHLDFLNNDNVYSEALAALGCPTEPTLGYDDAPLPGGALLCSLRLSPCGGAVACLHS